ncbi:hypothetical protein EUX98_g4118 [Antrodiella citrinella]|uniref:NAD(P)-binding protein n=1 Tax=Antrodiella citrinella TaxID=2447956 RepID=A0A4S4MWX7_9APHY|nr:hypothetical protein EUX98_g4118 [Antrodiella citrinella]
MYVTQIGAQKYEIYSRVVTVRVQASLFPVFSDVEWELFALVPIINKSPRPRVLLRSMIHTANISDAKCILVVGATAGIGRDLAIALHDLPSRPVVVVTGRRQERLDELSSAHERVEAVNFDVTAGREELEKFVKDITAKYPHLDALVFAAGVQHVFNFHKPEEIDLDVFDVEINTNYTSIAITTILLLPHFLKLNAEGRPSFIVPISSGLGLCPAPWVPNYAATKAAVHSFALSLSSQLEDTNVHVMEIIPPLVESELHDHQGTTPRLSKVWMPLSQFTPLAVEGLLRGDLQIAIGNSHKVWERFDKEKVVAVAEERQRANHIKKD